MVSVRAAIAAAVLCACAWTRAAAADSVSLDDAFQRVISSHPDLQAFRFAEAMRMAESDQAQQGPPLRAGLEAENLLGTGSVSGIHGAELTLSLASVMERGGKREARVAVAAERLQGLAALREAKRLDLLAEVARRFLDAVAAQAMAKQAEADLAQRVQLVAAAKKRQEAGIEAASAPLAAEAARVRVAGDWARYQAMARHARQRLALLWGGGEDFELASVELERVPTVPRFAELTRLLDETPELQQFASEARLREARLQLARSARLVDLDWQVGLRRIQSGSDWALMGSVSVPLGSAARSEPGVRAAEAELAAIALEREGAERALQSTLAEAWAQLDLAVADVRRIEHELLPALQRAADAAETSYRAGASSYLEWAQLQGEHVTAQRAQLEAALSAHRALIELQRLTGQTFAVTADTDSGVTP